MRTARLLTGATGEITVDHRYSHARRRRVFDMFLMPYRWLTWEGAHLSTFDPKVGDAFLIGRQWRVGKPADQWILGSHGDIKGEWIEIESPSRVGYTWTWRLDVPRPVEPTRDEHIQWRKERPAALPASSVRIHIDARGGDEQFTLHVTHSCLPQEWLTDMTNWWSWQLERCETILSYS